MKAFIKEIKLIKLYNNHSYFKVKLEDEYGNKIGTFGKKISNAIDFRTELFVIMSACNCFNLLKILLNNPQTKEVIEY